MNSEEKLKQQIAELKKELGLIGPKVLSTATMITENLLLTSKNNDLRVEVRKLKISNNLYDEKLQNIKTELMELRDFARTGLSPEGYTGKQWAEHKCFDLAAGLTKILEKL